MKIQITFKQRLFIHHFTITKSVRLVIVPILLFFTRQLHAQSAADRSFVINGTVTGVNSGIVRMLTPDKRIIDSAAIVKGKFVFRGKISLPERKIFWINPGYWQFFAFVDAPAIALGIDTTVASHQRYKDSPALIYQIEETGSPMGDAYTQYQNETGFTDYVSLFEKLKTARKDSIAYLHSKMDSIGKLFYIKQKSWIEKYTHQNPASLGGIYIFNEYCNTSGTLTSSYLRSVLSQFSGAAKASPYYSALSKKLSDIENMQVGKTAPNFTLLKRDKSKFTLSATRGSVIMLDFWASWCVPCRQGIPYWKNVYAKYHVKNFNIVSVSDDSNWRNWIQALNHEKMPWTQVIDEFPSKHSPAIVISQYNVPAMPFFVLLNKKEEVVMASGDEVLVTKKIKELLN